MDSGLDVVVLGVNISVLVLNALVLSVDISVLVLNALVLNVDISVLVSLAQERGVVRPFVAPRATGGAGGRENARWPEPGAAVQHGRHKSRDWPWQGLAFAAAATQWGRWKPPRWPEPGAAVQQSTVPERGPRQSTVRGRKSVWWGPQHPSVGGAELQGRGPRKCTVREQGLQQSTVRERRSVWRGPQHPSVGGG